MDTNQLKALRAEMTAEAEKYANQHRANVAEIGRLLGEQKSLEAQTREVVRELRKFDKVYGKRLNDAPSDSSTVVGQAPKTRRRRRTKAEMEAARSAEAAAPATPKKRGRKPGPKTGKKAKSGGVKAAAKKPGPKPKAAAKPKGMSAADRKRLSHGRQAVKSGERPTMREAIRTILGGKVMHAQDVYEGLKEKGWLPNAKEPRTHVGHLLSSMNDSFERVPDKGRGYYRALSENGSTQAAPTNGSKRTTNGSKRADNGSKRARNGSKRVSNGSQRMDSMLADAGINPSGRPSEDQVAAS